MKKILFILPLLVSVCMACEEISETFDEPALLLDVTSSYVVFGADGGSRTVLVTSNAEWSYSCEAEWFRVVRGEDYLEITASANDGPDNRQAYITVTAGEAGELIRTVSVAQVCPAGVDLSETAAANCYIVGTGTTCRFNAMVKGNGVVPNVGGAAVYCDEYGVGIDEGEIVYADLLWEAVYDGDRSRSCGVIAGEPFYSGGYVYFTTGESEGNAVIAVRDAGENILWSWHIWVCDSEIEETEGNGYFWQDRNLGATSKEPGDINNRGLLYQWGRKDPFLPSAAEYDAVDPNVLNFQVGDGSGSWHYTDFTAKGVSSAPGNIPYSVRNPMSVLLPFGSVSSWYVIKANSDNGTSYLWGRSDDLSSYVKSIFDPCPPGYNVPVANAWASNDGAWTVGDDGFGAYWTGGGNAYYPFNGVFLGTTATMVQTSTYGDYLTSAKVEGDTEYTVYFMDINQSGKFTYTITYPVNALPIRCMRAE